ncbi:hypothetical protein FB451DRAFT_197735 [Mycena latifolia]|nr:hypothetical protein FB451DRAFT_197735 [Mycena latifolia]
MSSELTISPCTNRAMLKSLRIISSSAIGDYLIHPGCSFDLSRLEDVRISYSMTPVVEKALECGRFTLKRLEYSDEYIAQGPKLEHFPALTRLDVAVAKSPIGHILDGISNAGKTCIETLCILGHFYDLPDFENWGEDHDLERFDTILSSSSSMPALQKVEFKVYTLSWKGQREVLLETFFFPPVQSSVRGGCLKLD